MNSILSAAGTDAAVTSAAARLGPATDTRTRFFLGMSWLLLLIVLVGFGPTLYLRAWMDVPDVPAYVVVHGIVMTAWFALFAAQTTSIAGGRITLHRQLGIATAGVGALVLAMATAATVGFAARVAARSAELPKGTLASLSSLIWGNFSLLAAFAVFLTLAIVFRARVEAHKRLMLLASISLLAPALARIARLPVFAGEAGPFVPVALLALLALLPIYDLIARRRLHVATLMGTLAFIALSFGVRTFGFSEAGTSLLRIFL